MAKREFYKYVKSKRVNWEKVLHLDPQEMDGLK